ncbi:CBS domain-containing protein [Candidatus Leptofilum sp.]|uniref:CBS domain-containing protein n=1 Tax=Candidatus Leptofilum sp. TaxID=3241576 RepID=UPI003B5AFB03
MNQLPVTVISENSPQRALRVTPETELAEILEHLLTEEAPKSVFLLDAQGGLAGIVNLKELLIWGWLHLGLLKTPFALSERKLRRLARAQTAADLRIPNSQDMSISQQSTVAEAMDTLLVSNLNVVAVVDENGRVVNDLHLEDLLAYAMRQSRETSDG